jgi:hypothetical protein
MLPLPRPAAAVRDRSLKFGRSAPEGNACEADVNVLSTIGWDLGRFGTSLSLRRAMLTDSG